MPKDLLSDAKIRTAKPDAKPYKLSDGGGLFLLIQPSGSKLWRWKFRLDGKENLFSIGSYPEVGLADARVARDAARKLAKQGINPTQHRKRSGSATSRQRPHESTRRHWPRSCPSPRCPQPIWPK